MGFARTVAKAGFVASDLVFPNPRGPRILIYHQVGSDLGRQMEVTTPSFRKQMNWLASHATVVTLEQAIARWEEPGSDSLVVLTFDDGYRDTFTRAFPIMRSLKMPFTLYLTTGPMEEGMGSDQDPAAPLNWDDVEEMMASGLLTVGAHTHSHPDLRHATESDVEREISKSDSIIKSRLGVTPEHFAYPYGYWSASADATVTSTYSTAVLGASPRPRIKPDPHQIHRYPVQLSDSFRFFPSRLRGGLLLEEKVRRSLRGYKGP